MLYWLYKPIEVQPMTELKIDPFDLATQEYVNLSRSGNKEGAKEVVNIVTTPADIPGRVEFMHKVRIEDATSVADPGWLK